MSVVKRARRNTKLPTMTIDLSTSLMLLDLSESPLVGVSFLYVETSIYGSKRKSQLLMILILGERPTKFGRTKSSI